MPISFDGPTRLITLEAGQTVVEVAEVYSRWKDWALLNPQFPEAFREVGGDPLGGGAYSGVNTFIRNDLGWRIKPPEQDIIVNLVGNLYPEDPNQVWRSPTVGNYDTAINTNNSANVLMVASGGGGGATPSQIVDSMMARDVLGYTDYDTVGGLMRLLLAAGRNRTVTDPATGKMTIYAEDDTTVLVEADIFEDADGLVAYRGQGAEQRGRFA